MESKNVDTGRRKIQWECIYHRCVPQGKIFEIFCLGGGLGVKYRTKMQTPLTDLPQFRLVTLSPSAQMDKSGMVSSSSSSAPTGRPTSNTSPWPWARPPATSLSTSLYARRPLTFVGGGGSLSKLHLCRVPGLRSCKHRNHIYTTTLCTLIFYH